MRSHRRRAIALRGAPRQRCKPDVPIYHIAISVPPARGCSLAQRRALLAGTMLAGGVLLTALAVPSALADGGTGVSV
jgi:hypothetical protein